MDSADAIRAKLGEVEGGDLQAQIPERGALEILEIIAKASAPKGGRVPPPAGNQLPPGYTTGIGPDGAPIVIGPDGMPATSDSAGNLLSPSMGGPPQNGGEGDGETEGEPESAPQVAPVTDSNAGILADDELVFETVDIRPLKIDLNLSATRATAQDRLAVKLKQYGCVREITKGMVRDRNDRKSFEMSIDHNCYIGSIGITEEPTPEPSPSPSPGTSPEASEEEADG
jgi:hypothetical protein